MPDTSGFFNKLLWAASILCAIAYSVDPVKDQGNLYLCIVLAFVVFVTGCFSYYQEASSAAVMEGFKNMIPPMVSCIRDGQTISIAARELVPGDIVNVNAGEKLPADVRVVTSTNFKVDQSSLTGEPDAIKKKPTNEHDNPLEATNLGFFGTLAAEGDCKGFVVQTGDDTVMGRIAQLAAGGENPETPISVSFFSYVV
jgi:sodium/potassium-transporting ATPase subunit alpha